jgi:hypothetical protein
LAGFLIFLIAGKTEIFVAFIVSTKTVANYTFPRSLLFRQRKTKEGFFLATSRTVDFLLLIFPPTPTISKLPVIGLTSITETAAERSREFQEMLWAESNIEENQEERKTLRAEAMKTLTEIKQNSHSEFVCELLKKTYQNCRDRRNRPTTEILKDRQKIEEINSYYKFS